MPIGNDFSGNMARGNSFPNDPLPVDFKSDCEINVLLNQNSDVELDIGQPFWFRSDMRWHVTNAVNFNSDIKKFIDEAIDMNSDVVIRVFNPLPFSFNSDIYMGIWHFGGLEIDADSDILINIGEAVLYDSDIEQEIVEGVDYKSDISIDLRELFQFLSDVQIHIHTNPDDPDVVNIAIILDRRYLPYMPESTMHSTGTSSERYKLLVAMAAAEYQTRRLIENVLASLRLTTATGSSLDRIGDRVDEKRWQFYNDRVDRFEGDSCYRERLIPYFRSGRGSLVAMQAAVEPLHDCYGGQSLFYSYIIGDGWQLGVTGRTELEETTFLGGPLTNMNPITRLAPADIWILDVAGHRELGISTYLGDRERLGPFTFFIEVWNYPEEAEWRKLYLHTIDRFKAAGTVPIVIFRRGRIMQHTVLTGDGGTTYTVEDALLEGKTIIVTLNGVTQTPGTAYLQTNNGDDTDIEFDAVIPAGWEVVVYWIED